MQPFNSIVSPSFYLSPSPWLSWFCKRDAQDEQICVEKPIDLEWKKKAIHSLEIWESSGKVDYAKKNILDAIEREGVTKNSLSLYHFKLTNLPPVIWQLTSLKELYIQLNPLKTLCTEIGKLTNLTTLFLNSIQLATLPTEIGELKCLTSLELAENRLTTLPTEIGQLATLESLNLNNNPLTSLPSEIGRLTRLKSLILSNTNLESLPKGLCKLTNLTKIDLSGNKFPSLPVVLWQLSSLTKLKLNDANLTTLPKEIVKLLNLTKLCLVNNCLTSLPTEIGRLTGLIKLYLNGNSLSSIPTEIVWLESLMRLNLYKNQLTSLPQDIGNLININKLFVSDNPNLRELPMSLGQIPGLTHIDISETKIDFTIRDSIMNQCRAMRYLHADIILPARLFKWIAIAKFKAEIDLAGLSGSQKKILNEWLFRLEKTKDFAKFQSPLAHTICCILADAVKNREFQELFFSQAEANNGCCQDRAAMAINEIYTSWRILCQSAGLGVMTGVAKTLCLRKELQNLIDKQEKYHGYAELESVEIFLYYESSLKDRLQLVTAIQNMAYSSIGKRKWIDEEALVIAVNRGFFDHLMALPVFEKLAKTELKEEWDKIDEAAQKELVDRPAGDEFSDAVLTWSHQQGKAMQERERAWLECVKKWYASVV